MLLKRLFCFLLSLSMCFSLVQASAFALVSDGEGGSDPFQQTDGISLSFGSASDQTVEPETTQTEVTETVQTPASETTQTTVTETVQTPASETTQSEVSETVQTSVPEATQADGTETVQTSVPETTQAAVSETVQTPVSETAQSEVSETVQATVPETQQAPASLPSAVVLAEANGVTVYSLVKVLFPCEQTDQLSGLQVINAEWQTVDPYIDPVSLQPYYDTYYLSPGFYAYRYQDENGQFNSIDYTPFAVEWDKPEQRFNIVLTPAAPAMDQIVDMELHSVTMVNPIYSAIVNASDIPGASTTPAECADLLQQVGEAIEDYINATTGNQLSLSTTFLATPGSVFSSADTFYKDVSSASAALKSAMISRKGEIKIYYQSSEQISWNTLCSDIYANSVSHTGVPTEGDYLLYEFGGYNATGAGPVKMDGTDLYTYLFNYAPLYYTTAEQEAEMTGKVNSVLSQLSLSGKTEYQKIKAIYDYLCSHVSYDNGTANDASYTLKYTGYAALVQGKAVCQGYSVAFYRLCLEAGLNARVIDSKQMVHAWNIARLGSRYYHLDATWDAGRTDYRYFLRGNTWWLQNHKQNGVSTKGDKFSSAAFSSSYPVPDTDYSESSDDSEETHTALTFHAAVEATCTADGTKACWSCDECSKLFLTNEHTDAVSPEDLVVKALGHDFVNGVCTRCGDAFSYQIRYECNGGTNAQGNPASYTAGADVALLPPSRTGYSFNGWYKTSTLSGTPLSAIASGTTGDLTLYAKWTPNTYTVVFDPNGGSGSRRTQAMTYDRQTALTANSFRKDGAAFAGWSVNPASITCEYADRQTVINLTAEDGGTVTLYAVWATNAYYLAFDANGGDGDMSASGGLRECGKTYSLPACAFTREGFNFSGWALSPRGRVVYADAASFSDLTTTNGKTVTLYAIWAAYRYSIVFDGNGADSGTMRPLENRLCGSTVTLTSNSFRRAGYTFTGWNTMPDGSGTPYINRARQTNFATQDGAVLTLYAQWSPLQYRITYRNVTASDGNPNPATYSADDPTIQLTGLSRAGNVFGGWFADSRFTSAVTSIPHGTSGNLTLYAKWVPYSYTIVFDANGGTGMMSSLTGCISGRSYSLRNNAFKRTGYGFAGWNTASDGSGTSYANRARVTSLSTENGAIVTLYAQWVPITFRITYRNVTTSDVNPNPVSYSSTETVVLQNLSRAGYVFGGWYSDSLFRTPVSVINLQLTGGAVTVYAKWTQLKYNIHFDSNARGRGTVTGTMKDLTDRLFGRTYILTSCSYRLPGYVFLGWSTDPNTDTPTYLNRSKVIDLAAADGETVTLYAVWRATG